MSFCLLNSHTAICLFVAGEFLTVFLTRLCVQITPTAAAQYTPLVSPF